MSSRKEDIALLCHFLKEYVRTGIPTKEISEKALIELKKMTWSGNIELRNVIERLIILSEKIIDLKDVKNMFG